MVVGHPRWDILIRIIQTSAPRKDREPGRRKRHEMFYSSKFLIFTQMYSYPFLFPLLPITRLHEKCRVRWYRDNLPRILCLSRQIYSCKQDFLLTLNTRSPHLKRFFEILCARCLVHQLTCNCDTITLPTLLKKNRCASSQQVFLPFIHY